MARGFGSLPVTGVSLNVNRGAMAEEAFGIATQPVIYGGTYSASGSFDAVYRSDLDTELNTFFGGFTTGVVTLSASIIIYDDVAAYTVTKYAYNSLELKGAVKDFLRVNMGFIAQKATAASGSGSGTVSYENAPSPFYNTTIDIGGAVKCSAFSIKFDRPIDTDNFILGSSLLQTTSDGKYLQNGASTVTGSVTMANSEYSNFTSLMLDSDSEAPATGNTNPLGGGELTITCSGGTITLADCKFNEGSVSAQGRNRFDKTISFMCAVESASDITCLGATVS